MKRGPTLLLCIILLLAAAAIAEIAPALQAVLDSPLPPDAPACRSLVGAAEAEVLAQEHAAAQEDGGSVPRWFIYFHEACDKLAESTDDRMRLVARDRWERGQKQLYAWATPNEQSRRPEGEPTSDALLASPRKVLRREFGRAVFAYPKGAVWSALLEALTDANIHPQSLDQSSGAIFLQTDAAWGNNWGDANQAVSMFTTKKVKAASSWQAIVASGNIYCKELDERETEVRVNLRYAGYNSFAAWLAGATAGWQQLESSGNLENRILDSIESRLPEPISAAQMIPAAKPDEDVVRAAEAVLTHVEKVDASIELGAAEVLVMNKAIDAQASLKAFASSPEADPLPLFTSSLRSALAAAKDWLSADAAVRPEAADRLRTSLVEAKIYLANYRQYVQEPTPKNP